MKTKVSHLISEKRHLRAKETQENRVSKRSSRGLTRDKVRHKENTYMIGKHTSLSTRMLTGATHSTYQNLSTTTVQDKCHSLRGVIFGLFERA
jgi:hypothetical protein